MPARTTSRGTAAAPLAYWLLLVSGLALLTVVRINELNEVPPLWLGAVLGTALGQILARWRLRAWLVGVIVLNSMWFGALMLTPFWGVLRELADPWMAVEVSVLAFAPAAVCGYLSLTERGGLASFWFPAVLWMMAILDRTKGTSFSDHGGWLLLSVLGALLLGFLHARETRRVTLWRGHASVRLAEPGRRDVLREAPLRVVAQGAWMAGLGAATLLLTTWIAPHLWQTDKLDGATASATPAATTVVPGAGGEAARAESCCPETATVAVQQDRVREYFPLLHAHDKADSPPVPTYCVPCTDGVLPEPHAGVASGAGTTTGAGDPVATVASNGGGEQTTAHYGEGAPVPVAPGGTAAPVATVTPRPASPVAPTPAHAAPPVQPRAPSTPRARPRPVVATTLRPAVATAPPGEGGTLVGMLVLSLVGLALHLTLRPLRRLMVLRHLGRPFWPETVDQRVSNLWQLMLVGLRDAGFRTVPGEQPQELARRIGLEGMKTCATVLERARHGVRVDAADLAAMREAAEAVYHAARGRVGWAARAAGWLRWPLA